MEDPIQAFVFYVVFLFSVTFHEAAHAWAALLGGDETAYQGGQVSLDPIPHIQREPFGMVVLPMISVFLIGWPFGFASTPYDPHWADRYPRRAAWMALAGPAANLALVIVSALLIRIAIGVGWFEQPVSVGFSQLAFAEGSKTIVGLAFFMSVMFSMNLVLFALNLIPVPPLDGSGAVGLLLSPDTTRRYQALLRQPMVAWAGIFIAWQLFGMIFDPIFRLAANLLYPGANYA